MNASGPKCTDLDQLMTLASNKYVSCVVSKSCTVEHRDGNPLPRYWEDDALTINSTGLANKGYKYYGEISEKVTSTNKPFIVSVAGLCQNDNLEMLNHLNNIPAVSAIELNLSCPNIAGKPQVGYDLDATRDLLRKVFDIKESVASLVEMIPIKEITKPLGLKLPPYFDPNQIIQTADLISEFPISYVTCINSLGNGLVIDPNSIGPVIKPKCGLGGIGGDVIKPFALSNVYQFRQALPDKIDVIGCGGISKGRDAFEHILVGATAVQLGSVFMKEGPSCFKRISEELTMELQKMGFKNLDECRGKFTPII
tara:strand:+ start:4967 stop:5899 length:933 start_codon:yes stop_codon:yes gene_type:complete